MWWRALLAAAVVTCTVTLAQGPQPLNQIKDILCVMLLNSIQKEDLGAITRRLQNVNISANNDELSSIQRIIELTTNETHTTKVIKENNAPKQPKETNKIYGKIVSSRTEKYLPDDQQIKCDGVMDYSKGQPTLFSLVYIWRNCLNISRPIENYTVFSFENTSISTQNKDNSNLRHKKFYVTRPPQEKAKEVNKKKYMQTLSDGKRKYDEHSVNGPIGKEIKAEVQFLQHINDFYKNDFNTRRNSGENLKLNEKSSKDVMTNESSFTTSNSVDINLNNLQSKLVRAVDSTDLANETRSDNSLYYGEYEEHNYLNTKDLINVKELAKNYKSGYGNIFYAYNESNAIKTNPGQFKDILKGLAKIPSNSILDYKNLEGKESKLDIIVKLHEVLKFLENTTIEKNNSHDYRPNTDAIERQFIKKNETPTTVLRQNFDAPEPARQDLKTISTANAKVVSVPSVHYVNYLPTKTTSNGSKLPAKKIPKLNHDVFEKNNYYYANEEHNFEIDVIKSGEIANNNNIPKDSYFYPKNIALDRLINYQESDPHKDAVRRQFTKNIPVVKQNKIDLYESMKNEILSTSAEVVSVSSIDYVNYLYPTKNINNLSGPRDSKTSKLMPQFSKKYIYSREADEHNYYQYEKVKVKVVASNRNLHQRYYFYPEISSNKLDIMMKPRLPKTYFTPNLLERVSGNHNDYTFESKTKKQDGLEKNISIISDAFVSRNGNVQNLGSDDSTKLVPNKSMPLARQSEQNKTLDTVDTCTQKYSNTTDRRMNADMNKNESVIIENNKILPKNIITDIAESVKAVILEDLRKELNISSFTRFTTTLGSLPTTIYTSTTTSTIKFSDRATRNVSKTHKTVTKDIILDKIMKFLEQMNSSKNAPHISEKDFQVSNENMKMLTKDIEILTTETYNVRKEKRQKSNHPTNRDYDFALQNHKNRVTVDKEIQRQKRYKLKHNIEIEPKTFQTNELEISPLGVYVESFVSPINQNIIVSPSRKERGKDNTGNNVNYYTPQETKAQTFQNNPFLRNYYPIKEPALTSDTRGNLRNNINTHSNDNYYFENRDESEEHKDVKYLDDKFLNKVMKDSTALKLPSNKDCCDREYVSQLMYECCNDKVVSRRQKSLMKNEPNNDSRYRNFLQSQHKVNDMLERVLASRTKFRSVESI